MTPRLRPALAALIVTLAAATAATASDPKYTLEDLAPAGRPAGYKVGQPSRYAIWHDADGWHVRATTSFKGAHVFAGTLEVVDGKMTSLTPVAVERKPGCQWADVAVWNRAQTRLDFKLTTTKGSHDGFDLTVSGKATALKLTLRVDGQEVPEKVFIGAKGARPRAATFYLPAHPGK
jgi:hypothetical protein